MQQEEKPRKPNLALFKRVVSLIQAGEAPSMDTLGANINRIHYDYTGKSSLDLDLRERDSVYIIKKTLFHIAIEARNTPALIKLIRANADIHIPMIVTISRWQESKSKFEHSDITVSTFDIAQQMEDSSIIKLIKPLEKAYKHVESQQKGTISTTDGPRVEDLPGILQRELALDSYKDKVAKTTLPRSGRQISFYGFPDKNSAQKIELKWQKKVTSKFFKVGKPLKEGKHSKTIYTAIKNSIAQNNMTPINIENERSRSFIIALSKILTEFDGMPHLFFQLGITTIELTAEDSITHRMKGNFKMKVPTRYDIAYGEGCINRLKNFLQPQWDEDSFKKRNTAFLGQIRKRLPIMKPFTHRELNKYQNIHIDSDKDFASQKESKTRDSIHLLNGLIFLITTVEVLVRLYRKEDGGFFPYTDSKARQSDSFPVAMAQARSLMLLLYGQITFTNFLGEPQREGYDARQHRADYGAVTGSSTIEHVSMMFRKLCLINKKYDAAIFNNKGLKQFRNDYIASNTEGQVILGRSRMYFDLKSIYGSSGESSEETSDYSDSEDSELEEVVSYTPIQKP